MTVLPTAPDAEGGRPTAPDPLTPAQRLTAFITAALLLALTAVTTHSAEAIVAVASPLLLLLGWVGSGRSVVLPARPENS